MAEQPSKRAPHTDFQILLFIVVLTMTCGLILSIIAYALSGPQKEAKEFDQRKQMLIASKILNHAGYFEILQEDGSLQLATFDPQTKTLVPDEAAPKATDDQIKKVSELRIRPLITDAEGNVYTLEEKNLTLSEYLEQNKKTGYANLPLKLFYAILPNEEKAGDLTAAEVAKELKEIYAVVIPVSGFGLWGPIYGYIALAPNGDDVIGTTWYEHAETPGLGANISEPWWQKQFYGKLIFQETAAGKSDLATANIGIIVVKGKVKDVYGTSPKAKSAVDGMSGATITGDGVTEAYHNSLTPYRNFFIKLNEETEEKNG